MWSESRSFCSVSCASARDAIHVATVQRHGVTRIVSLDAGFDAYTGETRLY